MRPQRLFSLLALLALCPSDGFAANSSAALDPDSFHQIITAKCIYEFKTDPRAAQVSVELRDKMCYCVDNWFRTNGINTEAAIKANQPVMGKVMAYCFQSAVGQ